jgi:acyl carrier protein
MLRNIADEVLQVDLSEVSPGTSLGALGMDSLDKLELVTALEDQLSVRIPDEELKKIQTVGGLVECLLRLQPSRPGQAG